MGNITIEIVLCILLPVCLLCFFLDSKSRNLMIAFMSGIIACLFAYMLNTLIYNASGIDSEYFTTTIAPLVEELLKYLPMIFLIKFYKNDIKGAVTTAFAVGVGFCVVENLHYLISYLETANIIWVISRCIGTGLMHSISATIIGIGLYYSYHEKRIKSLLNISAYFFAVMYHGLFNMLAQSDFFQVLAILIPILSFLFVQMFLYRYGLSKVPLDGK